VYKKIKNNLFFKNIKMKNESNELSNEFECRCSIKTLNTLLILTPPPNPLDMEPSKHQKKLDREKKLIYF